MKSRNLKNHFAYRWWVYLISGACVTAALLTIYNSISKPKSSETLILTYVGRGLDYVSLEKDTKERVSEFTKQTVKQLSVENPVVDNHYQFDNVVRSRSSKGVDLFLIERSVLDEYQVDIPSYFAEVKLDRFNEYFVNPIVLNDKTYGCNVNLDSYLGSYYSNNSTLELYFNINSEKLQYLFDKGENKLGIEFAKYLLGDK